MIKTKEQIIEYFQSGIKVTKDFKIGIEHEKFLFDTKNNKRIDYTKVKEMFAALTEFGWNPIFEKENIIGLNKGGKNISLEPGNQVELSGLGRRIWSYDAMRNVKRPKCKHVKMQKCETIKCQNAVLAFPHFSTISHFGHSACFDTPDSLLISQTFG